MFLEIVILCASNKLQRYSFVAQQNHSLAHKLLIRQNSNFCLSDNSLSNKTALGSIQYHLSSIQHDTFGYKTKSEYQISLRDFL